VAFDKTQIVNRALVKLGSRPITNLDDDDTEESRTALNLYDIALESILSECLWGFATKRELLGLLSDTIVFNTERETLSYIYQRPNNVARIFRTNDTGAYWREEGSTIVSDTAGLGVIFTFVNEDEATYPPYFVTALSDLLASEMSYPLLNSRSKTEDLYAFYQKVSLPNAMSINSQIGTAKELNDDYWVNARHGGANVQEFS